ncbi:hypothetical protein NCTGTJJY_CDS0060 [Serratia phage 92A1]|nr:hypothetical protein NCTGTJJY_CDS0060 [Serratia phage 92A1]
MEEKLTDAELDQVTQDQIKAEAKKQAATFVRKNRKELHRLRKHAETALLENNKAAYVYAISKLRKMLKQETTDELLESLWNSNRQVIFNIISGAEG